MRWWATDPAIVACAEEPTPERVAYATERLGVILSAYTVYLDLWVCDAAGRVVANGRPDRFPAIRGASVAHEEWFRRAAALPNGDTYVAAEVATRPLLQGAQAATNCASIRADGRSDGGYADRTALAVAAALWCASSPLAGEIWLHDVAATSLSEPGSARSGAGLLIRPPFLNKR